VLPPTLDFVIAFWTVVSFYTLLTSLFCIQLKNPKKELDSLSEWVKYKRGILKSPIKHVRSKMHTIYPSAFHKPEVVKELNRLHEEYVLVTAYKASNNIVFVCKAHYYQCIINELHIDSAIGNRTCTPTSFSKEKILQNQHPF
jgi:hypothetical protein